MVLVQDFWIFYFEESSIKTLPVKKERAIVIG